MKNITLSGSTASEVGGALTAAVASGDITSRGAENLMAALSAHPWDEQPSGIVAQFSEGSGDTQVMVTVVKQ